MRCGVEFFDYYWLHALAGTNYENVQKVGAFYFLVKKKEEGRIRHIGFSFHDSPELLERILKEHPETEYTQGISLNRYYTLLRHKHGNSPTFKDLRLYL